MIDPAVRDALHVRLRRLPSRSSVAGSLPVVFFGDLVTARVATIGLNPSPQEYLNPAGEELTGNRRRFETLASLGATTRESLTPALCDQALATMQAYSGIARWPGPPAWAPPARPSWGASSPRTFPSGERRRGSSRPARHGSILTL